MKPNFLGLAVMTLTFILLMPNFVNAQQNNRQSQSGGGIVTRSDAKIGDGGSAIDVGDMAGTAPTPGSDNPPPYRDPNDATKSMTMTCSSRTKQTTPGWLYGWDCTSSMSCSCTMTYRDEHNNIKTCAASPLSATPSGTGSSRSSSQAGRNACIAEADAAVDAQRDAFFATCAAALANCPP